MALIQMVSITHPLFDAVQLLRVLLRLHYNKTRLPSILSARFVQILKLALHPSSLAPDFHAWPLEEIVPDEKAFFAFLQERWPVFLSRLGAADRVREGSPDYRLKYPGPDVLPFDHQDIRVYIDNLFVEGMLAPVHKPKVAIDSGSWIRSGIVETGADDDKVRIFRLFELVENGLPTAASRYSDWIAFALKWAELSALVRTTDKHKFTRIKNQTAESLPCSSVSICDSKFSDLQSKINNLFAGWLTAHYASLINLPPTNPAMLHHVPRRLARDMEDVRSSRVALLVVDGLALDQWVTIRRILQEQDHSLVMREFATFAWIPTLTSVSRQSIFSGKPPLYFPSSINSTGSDGNLWKQFWEGVGVPRLDIAYQRGLGDGDVAGVLEANMHPGKTRAIGLVVDKVDKIMHGMQLGAAGMHNQIKQWCQGGFLGSLIGYLLDHGYQVWMTSDHGNIECRGKGRPAEGVIAETRGERARVYPTPELRSQVAGDFAFAREWQPVGLPSDYFPLVAGGSDAFVNPGDSIVGHGGIAIEEVIVPLVKFERRTR